MNVYLTPPGRSEVEVYLTDEPEYGEQASGATTATVVGTVPDYARDRLVDAEVRIQPPRGEPWLGSVAEVDAVGGLLSLICVGAQADLERFFPTPALYCDTRISEFSDYVLGTNYASFQTAVSFDRIEIIQSPNTTCSAGHSAGFWRWIDGAQLDSVSMTVTRPHAKIDLQVYSIVTPGSASGGTLEASITSSGSHTVDLSGRKGYLLRGRINDTSTPSVSDTLVRIEDLKLYGVQGVTAINPANVTKHVASTIPSWSYLSDTTEFIGTDATTIEPLVFDYGDTALDILDELREHTDSVISVRPRMVGGRYVPCLTLSQQTDPSYQMEASAVDGAVRGGGILSLADGLRAGYSTPDGRARFIDVTDTGEGYLQSAGRGRMITEYVPTSSTAVATSWAARKLATMRKQAVLGSPIVTAPIHDMNGAEVWPCEIQAGRVIRVYDTPLGTVDARIVDVTKRGAMEATLTLDAVPKGLGTELALMRKRST